MVFYTQIILQLFAVVLLVLTPDKFFSKHYKRSQAGKQKLQEEMEHLKHYVKTLPNKKIGKNA
jgi:hypothetical protein